MVRRPKRILLLSIALGAALTLPGREAEPSSLRAAPSVSPKAAAASWRLPWSFLGWLVPAWAALDLDNGCQIDPDGRCLSQATVALDNGCQIDPSGRPRSACSAGS